MLFLCRVGMAQIMCRSVATLRIEWACGFLRGAIESNLALRSDVRASTVNLATVPDRPVLSCPVLVCCVCVCVCPCLSLFVVFVVLVRGRRRPLLSVYCPFCRHLSPASRLRVVWCRVKFFCSPLPPPPPPPPPLLEGEIADEIGKEMRRGPCCRISELLQMRGDTTMRAVSLVEGSEEELTMAITLPVVMVMVKVDPQRLPLMTPRRKRFWKESGCSYR